MQYVQAVGLLEQVGPSIYIALSCSQNHAITSSFPVAVYLESFRCLLCSKMPFSSAIPIFARIHVLVFRSVQLILSIRLHTHISKALTSFSSHFFSAHNPATRFRPPSASVVSAEPFSHGTGTLRCLQKEMATYRH